MPRIPIASLGNGVLFTTEPFASPANPAGVPVLTPAGQVVCFVFLHTTTTPVTVFTDETGSTPIPFPLISGSDGSVPGWVDASLLPLDLSVVTVEGPKVYVLTGGTLTTGVSSVLAADGTVTVAGSPSVPTFKVTPNTFDTFGVAATETTRATTAEALLAPKASPALTGTPTAPTQTALDSSTRLATTAYSDAATSVEKTRALAAESANTTAVTTEVSRAQAAEALKAPLASPALTGSPTAPTQTALDASTKLSTTAYADAAVGVEASARSTADALKAPLASPVLTGAPTAPTQAALDNSTKLSTTAYSDGAVGVEKARALTVEATLLPVSQKAAASGVASLDASSNLVQKPSAVATTTDTAGLSTGLRIHSSNYQVVLERLNVLDKGYMISDGGASDQHVGLQAAVTDAATASSGKGGGLYVPAGLYSIGATKITAPACQNLSIVGDSGWGHNSLAGSAGGGTFFKATGDPNATLLADGLLDLTAVVTANLESIGILGNPRFTTGFGIMPCASVGVLVQGRARVKNCAFQALAAGVGLGKTGLSSDHITIDGCYTTGVGFGIFLMPGSTTGADNHFRDLNVQANCAGIATALSASQGLIGCNITACGLLAPFGVIRFDDGSGLSGVHQFVGSSVWTDVHCEQASHAAVFDELWSDSTRCGPISGVIFNPSNGPFFQCPNVSSGIKWAKTISVASVSTNTITLTDNSGFLFRKGMTLDDGGTFIPVGTTVTSIAGSWPWTNPVLTLSATPSGTPATITVSMPYLATFVCGGMDHCHFGGPLSGLGASTGFPMVHSPHGNTTDNTIEDGTAALVQAGGAVLFNGFSRSHGNRWGNGAGIVGCSELTTFSPGSIAAGDLLMHDVGSAGNNDGWVKKCDGTRKPIGVAVRAVSTGQTAIDIVQRTQPKIASVPFNNNSGATIAIGVLLYADAAHPGGVTATQPGSGWTLPIGVNGQTAVTTGSSGTFDELWLD